MGWDAVASQRALADQHEKIVGGLSDLILKHFQGGKKKPGPETSPSQTFMRAGITYSVQGSLSLIYNFHHQLLVLHMIYQTYEIQQPIHHHLWILFFHQNHK